MAVPRALPPGTYRGGWWVRSAQGRAGGQVELTVWRATLPETPTLRSSINQWNDHSLAADRALLDHEVMPLWTDPAGTRELAAKGAVNASGLGFWSGAEAGGGCRVGRPPSAAQIAQRAAAFPRGPVLYNLTADGVETARRPRSGRSSSGPRRCTRRGWRTSSLASGPGAGPVCEVPHT